MIARQITARGVRDARVLEALRAVPRELFVPEAYRDMAYDDCALPIGEGQTISQPFVVAAMTAALGIDEGARVLEVGTGSGYQAAVLAGLGARVFTIEILEPLAERAAATLDMLGYTDVQIRIGDGYTGWPEAAPFDAILIAAATDHVPDPLVEQLAVGGRLVVPLGPKAEQELVRIRKTSSELLREPLFPVRFVPMTGNAESDPSTRRKFGFFRE